MDPKKMSNDVLAMSIELWTMANSNLSQSQIEFFEEVVWRLKLMPDMEKDRNDG